MIEILVNDELWTCPIQIEHVVNTKPVRGQFAIRDEVVETYYLVHSTDELPKRCKLRIQEGSRLLIIPDVQMVIPFDEVTGEELDPEWRTFSGDVELEGVAEPMKDCHFVMVDLTQLS